LEKTLKREKIMFEKRKKKSNVTSWRKSKKKQNVSSVFFQKEKINPCVCKKKD